MRLISTTILSSALLLSGAVALTQGLSADGSVPVVTADAAHCEVYFGYPYGDSFEGENLGVVNVSVPYNSSIRMQSVSAVEASGKSVTVPVSPESNAEWGTVILDGSVITDSGTWTITLPEGFVTDSEGKPSAETSRTLTFKNTSGAVQEERELVLSYAYLEKDGERVDLTDPESKVPAISGWTVHVATPSHAEIEEMHLSVSHFGIDDNGQLGEVNDRFLSLRKEEDEFVQEIAGFGTLEAGTWYTFTFDADSTRPGDNSYAWTKVIYEHEGGTAAYDFSPVELLRVQPELESEITNPKQVITLFFSAPVDLDMNETVYNEGQGASSRLYDVNCNADRTEWYITIGESKISNCTSSLDIVVAGYDLDGKRLKGNQGDGARSAWGMNWNCYLGRSGVILDPAPGVVESLYEFTAVSEEEGGGVGLGNALYAPYICTPSGAVVATVVNDEEKKYDADGTDFDDLDPSVDNPTAVKSVFHLDKEITAPGKYIFTAVFGAFEGTRPFTFEYIIEGTPEFSKATVADGARLADLSLVALYADNEVELSENASMNLRTDEGVMMSAPLRVSLKDGVSVVLADFSDAEGNPYRLEQGVAYRLQTRSGSMRIAGTDMEYPVFTANISAPSSELETVKLTHEVTGHAVAVAEVAKGKRATVSLTPAEGWKIGTVLFNGEDVTADVKYNMDVMNNLYVTPALESDSKLTVSYEYDGELIPLLTGVELVSDLDLRVWADGNIHIGNLKPGMEIGVYTIDGAKIGSHTVAENDVLEVEALPGIYVVTVAFDGKTRAIRIVND